MNDVLALSGFFASNLLTGMFLAMASLALVTVIGVLYPRINQRSRQTSPSSVSTQSFMMFGSNEMNSRLEGYKKDGKFDEGIVLIYKSLRDLIPALAETGSREWTELELLKKVLESSPELRNVSSLIMQGYQHYESTRFGDGGNESSFGSMMGIVNDISHLNMVIRARAKRA